MWNRLELHKAQRAVGSEGRIMGVDLTDAMLDMAQARVQKAGWSNVDLVQIDMVDFMFPPGLAGVFSTLAITLVEEYDAVIRQAANILPTGGRLAVFDMKQPEGWPDWLLRLAARLNQPFGVSLEIAGRKPQESIRRYLKETVYQEFYLGALYLSVGEKSSG